MTDIEEGLDRDAKKTQTGTGMYGEKAGQRK